jgi:hypothetical protein
VPGDPPIRDEARQEEGAFGVGVGVGEDRDKREALAVGEGRPWGAVVEGDAEDRGAGGMGEGDAFTPVGEGARVGARGGHARVTRGEGLGVPGENQEAARGESGAVGEPEGDAVGELDPAQVEGLAPDILEFEKLEFIAVGVGGAGGVVVEFGDEEFGEGLGDGEFGVHQGAPFPVHQRAGLHRGGFEQADGGRVGDGRGGDGAAGTAGVGSRRGCRRSGCRPGP